MSEELLTCPGCGYRTIQEEYDICAICFWENDYTQNDDPHFWGGANLEDLYTHQLIVHRLLEATDSLSKSELQGYKKDDNFEFIKGVTKDVKEREE